MMDLDKPDEHDSTHERREFGGPYRIRIDVAGETVYDDVVRKDDRMDVYTTPLGDVDELKDVARDMYEHGDYSVRDIAVHVPATIDTVREWVIDETCPVIEPDVDNG